MLVMDVQPAASECCIVFHSVCPPRLSYPLLHRWTPACLQLPIATTRCDEHLLRCPAPGIGSPLDHTYSGAEVLGHRVGTKYYKIDFQAAAQSTL